jgi:hypothetical protein
MLLAIESIMEAYTDVALRIALWTKYMSVMKYSKMAAAEK